jgi:hypothetical protein
MPISISRFWALFQWQIESPAVRKTTAPHRGLILKGKEISESACIFWVLQHMKKMEDKNSIYDFQAKYHLYTQNGKKFQYN